jgi:hypothetical protein
VSAGSLLDIALGAVVLEESSVFDGSLEDIDAAHMLADGRFAFSTTTPAFVGGKLFLSGDVILYDPASGSATTLLRETDFTGGADVDALYLYETGPLAGQILFSSSVHAELAGLVIAPGDVIRYDPEQVSAQVVLSQSAFSGTTGQRNVDALHRSPGGRLILSVALSGGGLGGLTLQAQDLVEYDPDTGQARLFLEGSELYDGTTANLNAFSIAAATNIPGLPAGLRVWFALSLLLGVVTLGQIASERPRTKSGSISSAAWSADRAESSSSASTLCPASRARASSVASLDVFRKRPGRRRTKCTARCRASSSRTGSYQL